MNDIEERVKEVARYFIETKSTVRKTADRFGVSRMTVYRYITVKLQGINQRLYFEAKEVLNENLKARYSRGGVSTQTKYREKRAAEAAK